MNLGHMIYLGNIKDAYLSPYAEEIASFINVQNVNLTIWDDQMIQNLIKDNFDERVLDAYKSVKPYAYKADLARLCILYVLGGWHSDIGIRFLEKIIPDKNIIVFKDMAMGATFDYSNIIQNSIIYSVPKQPAILECIVRLSDIYVNKIYGNDPAYIGGTVQMGEVFRYPDAFIGIGKAGENFTTLKDLMSGKTILEYFYDGVHVADFKDFNKKALIPITEPDKMLWGLAWDKRLVY